MQKNVIDTITKNCFNLWLESYYIHEFTVTYNPKFIYDIPYALSMTDYVIMDIQKLLDRNANDRDYIYNYTIEYQKNGYPHIHGTFCTPNLLGVTTLFNFEKKLTRQFGKTMIWATGHINKQHHNDHFTGTWQQYLEKDGGEIIYKQSYYPEL